MKTIRGVLIGLIVLTTLVQSFAQAPQKFNYQAVCRDNTGNVIQLQTVSLRLTIHDLIPGGAVLYKETHIVITNNFGLVTVAVGSGTVDAGSFSAISWGIGDKYLEVELDAGSGFNSVGTSQLLSVPYALHAKTADSLTTSVHYSVGDFAHGGIVFWVDATGQHGLVCAKSDQSLAISSNGYRDMSQPPHDMITGDGIYGGKMSTVFLSMYWDSGLHPARVCQEVVITENSISYGDWYLPSKEELNLMYINKNTVNDTALVHGGVAFASSSYWSSTSYYSNLWLQWFTNGNQYEQGNGSVYGDSYVRAIRAF